MLSACRLPRRALLYALYVDALYFFFADAAIYVPAIFYYYDISLFHADDADADYVLPPCFY